MNYYNPYYSVIYPYHEFRNSYPVNTYYNYPSYYNYPFYPAPIHPIKYNETDHQINRGIINSFSSNNLPCLNEPAKIYTSRQERAILYKMDANTLKPVGFDTGWENATLMAASGQFVYLVRRGELIKMDANTLKPVGFDTGWENATLMAASGQYIYPVRVENISPRTKIVVGCISGLFGHADVLGNHAMRDFRDFLRNYLKDWVNPENIFYQSWNPGNEDKPFDAPATGELNRVIQGISNTPCYLALIGFSYGGWAVSRLSRITKRIPDFIGLIDPVYGPRNDMMNTDIPRGRIIKSWYQKYAIQELEPCTGASKIPCSSPQNGIACGNQNIPGAENIHEEFLKNWEGNRERKPCPVIGRVPIHSTHANIAGSPWIWRQIAEKLLSDIRTISSSTCR
ncbi:hypothetical protein [Bacillus cereus group sp. BfR-BA-01538]|uniref:hypothetical protein n=1 Tax=Bacillus cereus group sp. BfR-BA-01538 TaxID=2920373 RepID=UPI001F59C8FB